MIEKFFSLHQLVDRVVCVYSTLTSHFTVFDILLLLFMYICIYILKFLISLNEYISMNFFPIGYQQNGKLKMKVNTYLTIGSILTLEFSTIISKKVAFKKHEYKHKYCQSVPMSVLA